MLMIFIYLYISTQGAKGTLRKMLNPDTRLTGPDEDPELGV